MPALSGMLDYCWWRAGSPALTLSAHCHGDCFLQAAVHSPGNVVRLTSGLRKRALDRLLACGALAASPLDHQLAPVYPHLDAVFGPGVHGVRVWWRQPFLQNARLMRLMRDGCAWSACSGARPAWQSSVFGKLALSLLVQGAAVVCFVWGFTFMGP